MRKLGRRTHAGRRVGGFPELHRGRHRCAQIPGLGLLLLGATGCATGPSAELIELEQADGLVTLPAKHVRFYRCDVGALMCDAVGRLSQQFCRCTGQRATQIQ